MQRTPTRKTIATWGVLAGLLALMLWQLAAVLAPFLVAAFFAYALTPVVDRAHAAMRQRVARGVVVLVVEVLFLLALASLVLMTVPIFLKELPLMRAQLPGLMERAGATLQPLAAQWGVPLALDRDSLQGFVRTYLSTNVEQGLWSVLSSLKLGGSVMLTLVGNAVLIPVVLFYLLADWHTLMIKVRGLVPEPLRPSVDRFMADANRVLGQYLRGQILVMVVLAVYYSTALALFGLDLAMPIGVFTGLAVFVPYLGFGLGLVLATLAGLLEFTTSAGMTPTLVMVAVVYGLGQLLEGFFLTPKLVGERIGLHPLALIFALMAFGQLFGLVGVLVALPVSAVLLVAIRRMCGAYLDSDLYKG